MLEVNGALPYSFAAIYTPVPSIQFAALCRCLAPIPLDPQNEDGFHHYVANFLAGFHC
jgi:hypothetical protein